jgi:hypothetical protein
MVPAAAVNLRVVASPPASPHVANLLAIPVVDRHVAAVVDCSVVCDIVCVAAVHRPIAVSPLVVASLLVSQLAVASLLVSPLVVVSRPAVLTLAALLGDAAVACSRVCTVGALRVAAATPAVSRLAVASPPADATEHNLESSHQTAHLML